MSKVTENTNDTKTGYDHNWCQVSKKDQVFYVLVFLLLTSYNIYVSTSAMISHPWDIDVKCNECTTNAKLFDYIVIDHWIMFKRILAWL